jgi:hypothetical protein
MSTDDRDIESSNPSKNFKVGDFDQRSGFFTPVWESKRRIRSEPPAPPSSKSEGSPPASSAQAEEAAAPEAATPDVAATGKSAKGSPRSRSASGSKTKRSAARNLTPVPPSTSESGAPLLPPAVAAVFDPAIELERESSAARSQDSAAEQPSEAPARPSAAARALRDAGPDLPPAAFLDAEPEFRAARPSAARSPDARSPDARGPAGAEERTDRSPMHQRSLRATGAAARIHDQLKAKLQAEAAEIDESRYDLAPDSQLPALPEQENDPYPQSLLRRLRRTIRLSSPVPDPIRSLISKYDRG